MSAPLILPQPGPPPQTPAAVLQLVKASLESLAAKLGQVMQATVLGTDAQGLTQLRIGTETLTVKLSQPLPAGTQIKVEIQPTTTGSPMLVVQPRAAVAQMVAPVVASSLPLPAPVMPPPLAVPQTAAVGAPQQAPVGSAVSAPPSVATQPAPQQAIQPVSTGIAAPPVEGLLAPATPAVTSSAAAPTGQLSPPVVAPPAGSTTLLPGAAVSSAAVVAPVAPPSVMLPATGAAPTVAANMPGTSPASTAASAAPAHVTTVPRPAPATSTPARTTTFSNLSLAQPAQAAARQDSIAPLLQNLSVLQRIGEMPKPVVEAAMRLLAQRLPLERGAPSGEAIRQAITRSGVFLEPPAKLGAQQVNVRSALLQLRAGLLGLLGGGELAAVAPVTRRPPPPLHDAQPRAIRAEAPNLSANAEPRDAARTLLQQTDATLSRLKLTQLASQPPDARQGAMALPDFVVELPMVLGHELSIAQLQVQRDGRNKGKAGERGWRLRFAVSFSLIGEVGAQISLLGKTTNVVLWADEAATAEALEAMLPELAPALQARGLDVGSVRVRRGVPEAASPAAGRLMDELR